MAGITGMSDTFDTPNYTGELFASSPEDTPLLSAIGGLTGGKEASSTLFEWQGYDLRDPEANRARLEGADAQTAAQRVRFNVTNVLEIHQETVDVSYTKQSAIGQTVTAGVAGTNPVTAEMPWQVAQSIKQVARDVEASFILGVYQKPSDNTTARKTRGLIPAITTNVLDKGTALAAASASTDTITVTHALTAGDAVMFTDVGASTTVFTNKVYYVKSVSTTVSFKIAATPGGTAITVGTATVALRVLSKTATTKATYDDIFQLAYDNGGIAEGETATIIVASDQKRNLSNAYANFSNGYSEQTRNVGGVNFQTIESDFGRLNVMLDRYVPRDAFVICSMEQLAPVFLNVPGRGHFFEEDLAKIGSSDRKQLYGEIGLEYGNEKAHGIIRGLPITY